MCLMDGGLITTLKKTHLALFRTDNLQKMSTFCLSDQHLSCRAALSLHLDLQGLEG